MKKLSSEEKRLLKYLGDRKWRLNNLYWIVDKNGRSVRFRLNPHQEFLLDNLWYLNIILKARQQGFSTFVAIFMLDQCIFNSNQTAGIIDYTLPDAKKKLQKALYAYNRLPEAIRSGVTLVKENEQELSWSNGSSMTADTTFRGSTLQMLHISEHAKICKYNPQKAEEIKTGALNAVGLGQMIFIESTAEDGVGDFYEIATRSESLLRSGERLSALDFKFFFFPWFNSDEYRLEKPSNFRFSTESLEYFKGLESLGIDLDDDQKYWYVKKKELIGASILKEFPATSKEAFESSTEDKYYKLLMMELKSKNRVCEFEIEKGIPVDLDLDLGRGDYTSVIFSQRVGQEIRIVDFIEGNDEHISYFIDLILRRKYLWGTVYLPHDGNAQFLTADKSAYRYFRDAGFRAQVLKATSIETGINEVRRMLKNVWFRRSTTEKLVLHLENYSKKWSENLGLFTGEKHDEHSHSAAAMRGLAMRLKPDTAGRKRVHERVSRVINSLTGY